MKKPRVLLHLAALAMGLCLLAGCAAQPAAPAQATIPHIETSPQPTVAPSPTPTQTPAQQQDLQQVYGSCGLLAWPSVLYSIYLQDDANPWTEEALAQTRQNLAVAVDWITQQAQTYNAQPKIYYDTGENDLSTFAAYKAGLTEDATTGTTFYDDVDTLTAQVDVEFIQQQYGTASIGYLIFLPVEGASYSILHYLEDGGNYPQPNPHPDPCPTARFTAGVRQLRAAGVAQRAVQHLSAGRRQPLDRGSPGPDAAEPCRGGGLDHPAGADL